jgi:hypothetical protein
MGSLLAHELAHSLVARRNGVQVEGITLVAWLLHASGVGGVVAAAASATVTRFLHDLLPWLRHSAFPVVDDGQTFGLVTVRRVNAVPVNERDRTTLREVACPLAEVARATPDEPVADCCRGSTRVRTAGP